MYETNWLINSLLICYSLLFYGSSALANGPVQDSNDLRTRIRKADQSVARGVRYEKANDFTRAIQCYQDAVTLFPDQAKFHFMLACAAWNARDTDLALKQYSKTIQLDCNSAGAYFGLALCKEKTKEPLAAIAALKECVRLERNFANGAAWLHLGRAYELVSEDANAEKAYDMCLSATSVSAYVTNEAKECLQKLKQKPKN